MPKSQSIASNKRKRGAKATEAKEKDSSAAAGEGDKDEELPPGVRRLSLHATVLIMHSTVLETKLSRWTGSERPVRLDIELEDEAEVAAFEDVVWGMYHGKLPAESMTVERALLIARLADAYAIDAMVDTAAAWLDEQTAITWDDALRIYDAPSRLSERVALEAAQTALIERAGDLEVAMNDAELRPQLAALPEAALVALLSDGRLAAAAESTVAAAAVWWASEHALQAVPDAVAACVRLRRLNGGFMAAIAHWFPQWTQRVLALLYMCAAAPAMWQLVEQMEDVPEVLEGVAGPIRGRSHMRPIFRPVVALCDVAEAFRAAVSTRTPHAVRPEAELYYGGCRWTAEVVVEVSDGSPGHFISFHVLQKVCGATHSVAAFVNGSIMVTCVAKDEQNNRRRRETTSDSTGTSDVSVCRNFFGVTLGGAWDASVFTRWADDAGNLNFTVKVSMR